MTCHKPPLVKLPPFYKTVACKRYLIGAEPPHIGHYLGYLPPPPSSCLRLDRLKKNRGSTDRLVNQGLLLSQRLDRNTFREEWCICSEDSSCQSRAGRSSLPGASIRIVPLSQPCPLSFHFRTLISAGVS